MKTNICSATSAQNYTLFLFFFKKQTNKQVNQLSAVF